MMHPVDLETFISGHLRRLPSPRAPQTLFPRVLLAVQTWSRRPWYSREWFTWPIGWQVGSIVMVAAMLVGGGMTLPMAQAAMSDVASRVTSTVTTDVPQVVQGIEVASGVAQVIWRAMVQPFLLYALVLVGLMCLACAMCAIALNRAVFGRALHS